ncbi:hypothetical protein JMJ35_001967 [Cladonia borealis]|uniref:BZIP domain-containing protein n=1 Tax=Cladonia borealis TaxID=184061 RepID=A0AA39R9T4_9LECA|nr:hypothetical protein JMJ35_001967 [Cladonia borealis]
MNRFYVTQGPDYCASPMSFANVPELMPCAYDDASTDPSPSPPMMYSSLDNSYHSYSSSASFPQYVDSQPQIINSIEFTDLTRPQMEDRRRRRSHTTQDKESISNMRIRRRAQNRASQRAFRERKEKHVQHLEHELEELESKHRTLEKSYTDLDSTHAQLKQEVKQLRSELESVKSSREGSISEPSTQSSSQYFDPFASDGFFGNGTADVRF